MLFLHNRKNKERSKVIYLILLNIYEIGSYEDIPIRFWMIYLYFSVVELIFKLKASIYNLLD